MHILRSLPLMLICVSAPALAETELGPDTVLVSDGENAVTVLDIHAAIRSMTEEQRALSRRPKSVESIIDSIYLHRAISADLDGSGLDDDPVAQRVAQIASERALAQLRLRQIEEAVDEEGVRQLALETYRAAPERFRLPEQVDADHILIRVNEETPESDALARIEEIRSRITAGEDFAELAVQYSEDPGSAAAGGAIGTFGRGQMIAPFENVAFALEAGEISEIVATDFGFHLIRVNERIPERQQTFAEVEEQLVQQHRASRMRLKREAFVNNYRHNDRLEIHGDAMWALLESLQPKEDEDHAESDALIPMENTM